MEDLKNIKEAAVRMALHCGKIQMESFRTQNIGIDTKSNVYDVVTKVDKACEDYLLTEIARLYPSKRRMFKLLTQVARDLNKAILLSTHDIDHAKRFGDVAWMMDKGQLCCSSFKELIAEKPDFFSSEEE